MPATLRAAPRCLAVLGLAAALAATAPKVHAGLLEQPPRRTTFNLNDAAAPALPLLQAFRNAAVERPGPLRMYLSSTYGRWQREPWWQLAWGDARPAPEAYAAPGTELAIARTFAAAVDRAPGSPDNSTPFRALENAAFDLPDSLELRQTAPAWLERLDPTWTPPVLASTGPSLSSNGFDLLWDPPKKPVRDWRCQRRPVQFMRYGGDHDTFLLVRCDGSVAPDALDRLSIMARPPEAPDPGEVLPDEPDAEAWQRALEWVPQVRLVHPRLLWLLQQIADAFPRRAIHIYSGYRPLRDGGAAPRARPRAGTHHSQHAEGRAVDIHVMGVPNATLFQLCRKLEDVGCGFYPNSKFVHVDVRRPGAGRLFWIDISRPGEPSQYVDAWPGVVDGVAGRQAPNGAPEPRATTSSDPGAPAPY